jgi:hypothetical protein
LLSEEEFFPEHFSPAKIRIDGFVYGITINHVVLCGSTPQTNSGQNKFRLGGFSFIL